VYSSRGSQKPAEIARLQTGCRCLAKKSPAE
jgi:hypothetical protein